MTMHGLPAASPAEVGLCPERTQRIVQVLQRDVDRGRLPGAAVLVARRGRVVLDTAVGRLDPARDLPMGTDAIFRIYSMTKPITSVALMQLFEQGRFQLDEPVARFLGGQGRGPPEDLKVRDPDGIRNGIGHHGEEVRAAAPFAAQRRHDHRQRQQHHQHDRGQRDQRGHRRSAGQPQPQPAVQRCEQDGQHHAPEHRSEERPEDPAERHRHRDQHEQEGLVVEHGRAVRIG